jgi:hypothetical protein
MSDAIEELISDIERKFSKILTDVRGQLHAFRVMEDAYRARAVKAEVERDRLLAALKDDRLHDALKEALEGWEYAAQYKGEYFVKKHGDMEEIAELRKLLAKEAGQ